MGSFSGGKDKGMVLEADVEGREGPGCCSTRISSVDMGTVSSAPLSISRSGEVEDERDVVEEVVEEDEWGDVSEEQAGGRQGTGWMDCGSDDSSPPAVEAAETDVGADRAPPVAAVPLLYS